MAPLLPAPRPAPSLSIGQRIRLLRERADVAPGTLAQLLGYAKPENSWWRIETGNRGLRPDQIAAIAKYLSSYYLGGVSCDWIITGREVRVHKRAA
jgi:Helix-turn-helix domain